MTAGSRPYHDSTGSNIKTSIATSIRPQPKTSIVTSVSPRSRLQSRLDREGSEAINSSQPIPPCVPRGTASSLSESRPSCNAFLLPLRRERHGHQELRGVKEVIRSFRADSRPGYFVAPASSRHPRFRFFGCPTLVFRGWDVLCSSGRPPKFRSSPKAEPWGFSASF